MGRFPSIFLSPAGIPWKRYAPAPFRKTKQVSNGMSFDPSPDGKKIVYSVTNHGEDQAWLLPFPPGPGYAETST
jgi:hypothetical protein